MTKTFSGFVAVAAAFVASTLVIGATASHAEAQTVAPTGYYVATPAEKPTKTSFLTRETSWKWRDGAYVANKSGERDLILCSLVAQRAGKLTSFAVAGTAFDAASLDKCNSRAK